MPITIQCNEFLLTADEVARLWQETIALREHADDQVTVRCVSEDEIRELNKTYRQKDEPTNVLTFSYPQQGIGAPRSSESEVGSSSDEHEAESATHDVALCLTVAEREAKQRGAQLRDYLALLLTHAFLHATGLDHEESEAAAAAVAQAERAILQASGFAAAELS